MEELGVEILVELQLVRWLLVAIVILLGFFVLTFFSISSSIKSWSSPVKENADYQAFQRRTEHFLMKGDFKEVVENLEARLANFPSDPMAHWFKARAEFQLGKLFESKHSFEKALELNPGLKVQIEPWLLLVNEKIRKSEIRSVD